MSDNINEQLASLQRNLERYINQAIQMQTEEIKKEIRRENENLTRKLQSIANDVQDLREKYTKLEIRNEYLERKIRKNNIVIFGLDTESRGADLPRFIVEKFQSLLDTEFTLADINDAYHVGKEGRRPIIVELQSYLRKTIMLKNSKKLAGTKIFISSDLTEKESKDRKILTEHLKLARSRGLKANIRNGKLYIGDEVYSADHFQNSGEADAEEEEGPVIENTGRSNSAPATPTVTQVTSLLGEVDVKKSEEKGQKAEPINQRKETSDKAKKVISSQSSGREKPVTRQAEKRQLIGTPTGSIATKK